MSFPENEEKKWKVPAYIDEGLKWLEKPLELKFEEKIFEVYQEEK